MRKGSVLSGFTWVHSSAKNSVNRWCVKELKQPLRSPTTGGKYEKKCSRMKTAKQKKDKSMPKLRDQYHGRMGTDSLSSLHLFQPWPKQICLCLLYYETTPQFYCSLPLKIYVSVHIISFTFFFTYWTAPLCSWIRLFKLILPFADYKEKMCLCGLQHWAPPSQVIFQICNTVNLYLEYATAPAAKMPLSYH